LPFLFFVHIFLSSLYSIQVLNLWVLTCRIDLLFPSAVGNAIVLCCEWCFIYFELWCSYQHWCKRFKRRQCKQSTNT
jgi:ABC-type transport system involved in Fe-S cluster assembly fused permease/ATPase subunit